MPRASRLTVRASSRNPVWLPEGIDSVCQRKASKCQWRASEILWFLILQVSYMAIFCCTSVFIELHITECVLNFERGSCCVRISRIWCSLGRDYQV